MHSLGISFILGALLIVVLAIFAALTDNWRVSKTTIVANVANAKSVCAGSKVRSFQFKEFCADNFIQLKSGLFLRARTQANRAPNYILENQEHNFNRYDKIDIKLIDEFGSVNDIPENQISAYVRLECAISKGQAKKMIGFQSISWTFDPIIKAHCTGT